jgi:ABC-type phosphate/phosphonate transport system substrate-binding protein
MLGYEIRLETARDFAEFIRRTKDRRYDLIETAPHLVSEAIDSNNYNVITTLTQPLTAQIVVLKNSPFTNINQLGNKIIATPSAKAIITKIGKETLNAALQHNLPTYQIYKTHNAAYEAVIGHHADAAIISVNLYNKAIDKNIPLISIGESIQIPNMSILIANNLGSSVQAEFQTLLINMQNTEEGRKVLKHMSYPGYRKTDAREFDSLRKYTK